jgi:putative flippase GtrA
MSRWIKFNIVGAGGVAVQLCTLAILKSGMGLDYVTATALAVEVTVLHNFIWHERFTWADRCGRRPWLRLAKFNITTGFFSILGNIALMRVLVGLFRLNYVIANMVTITVCSTVNFVVSDRLVFEPAAKV